MPKAGLNRQVIVDAAIELIEEKGYHFFNMRSLADVLKVKAASLYNHIKGSDEILAAVGKHAVESLNSAEFSALDGLKGDQAVRALAATYRKFAKDHPELYKVIMDLHRTDSEEPAESAHAITVPFMNVLSDYPLDEPEIMHWQRVLRSILHGFLSQEEAGYFCHFPIDEDISYQTAIQCYIDGLKAAVLKKESDHI